MDPKLQALLAKARRGEVTHEELVDTMLDGAQHYGKPTLPREQVLAQVRARFADSAAVSRFVLLANALTDQETR